MSSVVILDVGGQPFKTLRLTLEQSPFFRSLMKDDQVDETDGGGRPVFFVDRDPTHFRHVLNWLRGRRSLPSESDVVRELVEEADYYCMDDYKQALSHGLERSGTTLHALQSIHRELQRMH